MSAHTTHHDDCGCLSAQHAQSLADANAAIHELQRRIERARQAIVLGNAKRALDVIDGKE